MLWNNKKKRSFLPSSYWFKKQCVLLGQLSLEHPCQPPGTHTSRLPLPSPKPRSPVYFTSQSKQIKSDLLPSPSDCQSCSGSGDFASVSTAALMQKEWCWCGTKPLGQARLEVIISCARQGQQSSYTAWTVWYPQRAFLAFWFCNSQVNIPLWKYKETPPSIFCSQ